MPRGRYGTTDSWREVTLTAAQERRDVAGRVRHGARRARRLTLVAVLALASTAATASAAPQLPDLVADAPGPSLKPAGYNDGTQRLLMRLDGFVHNAGS